MVTPPAGQPLKTKLFVPPVRQALVARAHLTAQIAAGVQGPLTLVSAPAGFGKTTLLAEWAARQTPPLAWVSLDAGDNDPARFLACLGWALQQIGLPVTLPDALDSRPPQVRMEALLAELAAAAPFVLVLDDYHLIQSPAVHTLLVFLLEHLPPAMHLVLATRADPPIPLARLRACGALLELRADQLRFSAAETEEFLGRVMGLALEPAQMRTLETRTEGWVTGLQLAALSMRGRADLPAFIRAFSGSHRYILDYLIEEVVNRQTPEIQQFLLRSAILEQLSGPLCAALTGLAHSQAILEELERANLFLVPLDDERRWYRYHHLFGELLRARLQQAQPESLPELHLRAAAWLEHNGDAALAIRHALAAGAFERAADLMERFGHQRWSFADMGFMNQLGQLPPELLQARPNLGVLRAWALILFGQLPAAGGLLRRLAGVDLPGDAGLRGFIELLLAYTDTLTGRTQPSPLPGREALAYIPEELLAMRNSAEVVYARLLSYQGRFDEAIEVLQTTLQRDRAADGTTAIPIGVAIIARLRILQGRLGTAEQICREYAGWLAQHGAQRFYIPGNLEIALGEVLLERRELDAAEQAVRAGLRANAAWDIPHATGLGYCALARVQIARGDATGAAHSLALVEGAAAGRALPLEQTGELRAARLQLALAEGHPPAASTWAQELPGAYSGDYRWESDFILLARLRLAEGQAGAALPLLEVLAASARAGGRAGRLVKIGVLSALAHLAQGQAGAAFAQLAASLALAEPEGSLHAFVEEGEPARALLLAYQRGAPAGAGHAAFVRRLLAAFPGASRPAVPPASLIEPLTPRELEVLRRLVAGDSNQEIAEKLVITVSAVKKHTGNIYGKLGVTSRTQAAARARELGLG